MAVGLVFSLIFSCVFSFVFSVILLLSNFIYLNTGLTQMYQLWTQVATAMLAGNNNFYSLYSLSYN